MKCVIIAFRDSATQQVWRRSPVKRFSPELQRLAYRKLLLLDAAVMLTDLRIPPGNRLEALSGDRSGQYSIRVNDQWRICFIWTAIGPDLVELVDYH